MAEEKEQKAVSRREFLKKNLKKAGYIAPALMVLSLASLDAWARDYRIKKPWKPPKRP